MVCHKYIWVFTVIMTGLVSSPAPAQSLFDQLRSAGESLMGGSSGTGAEALSETEITSGLREALRVGTSSVVSQLGTKGGFTDDPQIQIPLPTELQQVQSMLRKVNLSGLADDVELKLNQAAEAAMPKTQDLIWGAINEMTIEDVTRIYNGPDDAATQYFKQVASDDLANVIRPVVNQALGEVGALTALDTMMGQYQALPFVPDVKSDLTEHAVGRTLEGLFHYLALEEASIRQNPAKRTTDLLTKVFGKS